MRWLLAVVAILAAGIGFGAWRTRQFIEAAPVIAAAPAIPNPVQIASAGAHFQRAPIFTADAAKFAALSDWLATTYPRLHLVAPREAVGGLSFLYTWPGSDAALPPALFVADANARAPLIAFFEAAESLAAGDFKPRRTILIALTGDRAGVGGVAARLAQRNVKAWFALGPGQAMLVSHPLTGKPAALIGVAERQHLQLRVVASPPPGGEAAYALARALIALETTPMPGGVGDEPARATAQALAADLPPVHAFAIANAPLLDPLIDRRTNPAWRGMLTSTLKPIGLAGGGAQTPRGPVAAFVDVGLHPLDTPEAFLARIKEALTLYPTVTADWQAKPAGAYRIANVNSSSYRLIAAAASRAADGARPAPSLYDGPTASPAYGAVAEDVYSLTPVLLTPAEAAAPAPNDRLSPANLMRMIGFYRSIATLAAG